MVKNIIFWILLSILTVLIVIGLLHILKTVFFIAQYNSKFIIKTIIKTHIYNNYYNMKKVVFIGNGDMYRSKFAEAYFNNLGKLECLFMLNTHGMGRYPSSRYFERV